MIDVKIVKKSICNIHDNSCINIMSGRKIKWTESKEKKMWFNHILQICCPKKVKEKIWRDYENKMTTPSKKIKVVSDKCDYFDWASDQEEEIVWNRKGHKDYILN